MRGIVAMVAMVLLGQGCSKFRTEVMLGFATDLSAPDILDHVQLRTLREGTEILKQDWDISGMPAQPFELPGSYGVYSADGSEPREEVDLIGYKSGTEILRRTSIFSLLKEQTLFMRMTL